MVKLTRLLALLACLGFGSAHGAVIIDGTTSGLYNDGLGDLFALDGPGGFLLGPNVSEGDPTVAFGTDPLASVVYPAAFGTDWLGGNYAGGSWSGAPVPIPSTWTVNSETAIVYDFTLAGSSDIHMDLGVDNGILVWLDGAYIFGAQAGGGSSIDEYDVDLTSVPGGAHSLQILREDHGGGTDFDILVDATTAVPVPATLLLLFTGLAAGAVARRSRTDA
jgi:hypothetical protein